MQKKIRAFFSKMYYTSTMKTLSNHTHIITGYYGSGKTEFCLNLAKHFATQGHPVTLADLDVINPYVRSREQEAHLATLGVQVVSSHLDNHTNQDMPALSFAFTDAMVRGEHVIIDLGGSTTGARVLPTVGKYVQSARFWCVLNAFRPETDKVDKMVQFIHDINKSSPIPINGLVNNAHLLAFTTSEHVLAGQDMVQQVGQQLNLPIVYTHGAELIVKPLADQLVSAQMLTFEQATMRQAWQSH